MLSMASRICFIFGYWISVLDDVPDDVSQTLLEASSSWSPKEDDLEKEAVSMRLHRIEKVSLKRTSKGKTSY